MLNPESKHFFTWPDTKQWDSNCLNTNISMNNKILVRFYFLKHLEFKQD